jgi:hypothetical protein
MALSESLSVGSCSTTTSVLNADIDTLTATKNTLEIIPVKAVFESVILILTLVRVRDPALSPCLCSLLDDTIRTG